MQGIVLVHTQRVFNVLERGLPSWVRVVVVTVRRVTQWGSGGGLLAVGGAQNGTRFRWPVAPEQLLGYEWRYDANKRRDAEAGSKVTREVAGNCARARFWRLAALAGGSATLLRGPVRTPK